MTDKYECIKGNIYITNAVRSARIQKTQQFYCDELNRQAERIKELEEEREKILKTFVRVQVSSFYKDHLDVIDWAIKLLKRGRDDV